MSTAREAVAAKRARLVERAELERADLASRFGEWERPLLMLDRGLSIARAVKRMPLLRLGIGVGAAALAFIRPRGITDWVVGGLGIWRMLSGVLRKG